jgi:hypothetical protein
MNFVQRICFELKVHQTFEPSPFRKTSLHLSDLFSYTPVRLFVDDERMHIHCIIGALFYIYCLVVVQKYDTKL